MIPFNKAYLTGKEAHYIYQAVFTGKLSGNGTFTKKCQNWMEQRYGFLKCLLTTSGTDALEMAAMLCDIKEDDEVIVPSYTFVSTALAFLRAGAKVVFADSMPDNPNIDASKIENLISPRTRVIVVVHYAGVACDMESIMQTARRHKLTVVEDAAQAIDSFYTAPDDARVLTPGRKYPLGGIGHYGAFSFHETKNITAGGEGGALIINDEASIKRAEIIWEKGTNRAEFFRGAVNKYGWVDMGSSFLPSEINAAFLWAQLENLDTIQEKRKQLWEKYFQLLSCLKEKGIRLPSIPRYASNNAHMFYLVCNSLEERTRLIAHLKERGITAPFHYLSLHRSDYYIQHSTTIPNLPYCDMYSDCLVRLPMFYELTEEEINTIAFEVSAEIQNQ